MICFIFKTPPHTPHLARAFFDLRFTDSPSSQNKLYNSDGGS
jgi:hypothetical protein